jgi:hypothetical protein
MSAVARALLFTISAVARALLYKISLEAHVCLFTKSLGAHVCLFPFYIESAAPVLFLLTPPCTNDLLYVE